MRVAHNAIESYPKIAKFAPPDPRVIRQDTLPLLKAALVNIGVVALARGDIALVQTVTSLIKQRGCSHV